MYKYSAPTKDFFNLKSLKQTSFIIVVQKTKLCTRDYILQNYIVKYRWLSKQTVMDYLGMEWMPACTDWALYWHY